MTKLDVALFWLSSRSTVVMLCKSLVKKLINRKEKKKRKVRNHECSQEPFHYIGFIPSCLLTVLAMQQGITSIDRNRPMAHKLK